MAEMEGALRRPFLRETRRRGARPVAPKIGLALAGGGPLGAVYEIGALCALDEAIDGLDLSALDGYVGVSAGGFIAAGLANGMTPRQLCTSFIESAGPAADLVSPGLFFRPAVGEFARRLAALPGLAVQAGWDWAATGRPLMAALERLGRAVPTGLFSNRALKRQLERVFSAPGRSNDFRRLRRRLVLVATDLDSGEAAPFGLPGWDHVPISEAVVASAALPGLFPPQAIDPLAPGTRPEGLRSQPPRHRHPALRARSPRPGHVPGQHLRLLAAPCAGRTRLPAHAVRAARAP
jgi:NTE family protein